MKLIWNDKQLLKDIQKPATNYMKKIGFKVEAETKQLLSTEKTIGGKHVAAAYGKPPSLDTGRLRASISTNWTGSGINQGKVNSQAKGDDGVGEPTTPMTVAIGTNVEYAQKLELGHGCRPHPFLRPAFEKVKASEDLK